MHYIDQIRRLEDQGDIDRLFGQILQFCEENKIIHHDDSSLGEIHSAMNDDIYGV